VSLMDKYKCKDFTLTGNLTLPVKWSKKFKIFYGTQVDVAYKPEKIFIRKANPNTTHNKRYVSERNTVHIPKEIREIADISPNKEYCLFIDEENKQFIIAIQ
jgi:bifunctional DNA-binding transcriptional regulator/antitoxin component of YhaV-PrlF toxin-antitoxin module